MDVHGRLIPSSMRCVSIGTQTLVTGGEPFIHPDLFDAVAAAKARIGEHHDERHLDRQALGKIIASGVDSLSFSIDGWGRATTR